MCYHNSDVPVFLCFITAIKINWHSEFISLPGWCIIILTAEYNFLHKYIFCVHGPHISRIIEVFCSAYVRYNVKTVCNTATLAASSNSIQFFLLYSTYTVYYLEKISSLNKQTNNIFSNVITGELVQTFYWPY